MKTISNPQSIFGGRAFKVTAIDFGAYMPNIDADTLPHRSDTIADFGPSSNPGNGGDCFVHVFGKC